MFTLSFRADYTSSCVMNSYKFPLNLRKVGECHCFSVCNKILILVHLQLFWGRKITTVLKHIPHFPHTWHKFCWHFNNNEGLGTYLQKDPTISYNQRSSHDRCATESFVLPDNISIYCPVKSRLIYLNLNI